LELFRSPWFGKEKNRAGARGLSLDEYRKEMRGIGSSVIGKDTLEESPMAYKKAREILDYLGETVAIEQRLNPLYNFKSLNEKTGIHTLSVSDASMTLSVSEIV
jgi:hypothetical protein